MKKFLLLCLTGVLFGVMGYFIHYYIYYVRYDEYKRSLKNYEYENGTEFAPLEDNIKNVDDMVLVTQNSNLKLYTNTDTTEIAIYDKRTGITTYSNPPDWEEDKIAAGINIAYLKSQLIVDYYSTARLSGTMNNYDMSIKNGQFKIEAIKSGIRFIYTFGDLSSPTGIVPIYIREERLKLYLDKMEAADARSVKNKYKESKTIEGFLELTSGSMKKATLSKMNNIFEEAGYTAQDYQAEKEEASGETGELITFTIPLEYRLREDGLEATISTAQILETGGAKIYNIQLLRYFGAGGVEEEGYLVVPNGSGSLIYFNNGKKEAPAYNQFVYGMDSLAGDYTVIENTEIARLPLFGIKRKGSAILAMIESGDALANISADISGKVNNYNYAYASFVVRGSEKLAMFGSGGQGSELPVVEGEMYKVNLSVVYSLLKKESASYSGMASYYREKLIADGVLGVKEKTDSIPLYLDLIGGVKQTAYVLGVPYLQEHPMTTYEEAQTIGDAFYEMDITNLRMNYQGWFNGGYYHDVADKITGLSKLGGKENLEALTEEIERRGGRLYVDVGFQEVSYISKRYRHNVESSKYYAGGYVARFGQVNPVYLRKTSSLGYVETVYDLISPKFLPRYVNGFIDAIKKYNITGISLRDLGDSLHSDKKRTNVINREDAKCVVVNQFKKLNATGKSIMVDGGNYYALAYSDEIINIPLCHNSFYLVDEEVPFYQMIIHGLIDYTGAPINLSNAYDKMDQILRLLEYGAAPHYTLTYKNNTDMKYSGLNKMYSTQYEDWLWEAKILYQEVNEVLKHVTNNVIVEHEIIKAGVKKIRYDNGVEIYINTNSYEVDADGIRLGARSYVTEGVE